MAIVLDDKMDVTVLVEAIGIIVAAGEIRQPDLFSPSAHIVIGDPKLIGAANGAIVGGDLPVDGVGSMKQGDASVGNGDQPGLVAGVGDVCGPAFAPAQTAVKRVGSPEHSGLVHPQKHGDGAVGKLCQRIFAPTPDTVVGDFGGGMPGIGFVDRNTPIVAPNVNNKNK